MNRRVFALLVLLSAAVLGVSRPRGLADVVEVRHWSYDTYTRVVVELSRPVESQVRYLGANRAAHKTERLYLDLPGFWVGRRYSDGIEVGDGLLRSVRLGQNTLRTTRVVIDVERYVGHRMLVLTHPHRLVIDVYGDRSGRWNGPRMPIENRGPLEVRPVKRIVVDAGHGGSDPGAIGVGGLREKDITLRLARSLGAKLEARGFEVVYTRNSDRSVHLEERTAIAEAANADVFVSLHANAAPRRSANGIETYYPDQDHERHSLRVAMRENGVTRDQLDELQRTLARLRIGEISPQSHKIASIVQGRLATQLSANYGKVQDLGAKKGPFYVLFLSNMPAILVEAGFVTNRQEAKRLRDPKYIDAVTSQIAVGLTDYRDSGRAIARRSRN